MDDHQQLERLEGCLKLVGAQGRETLTVGPFESFVSASANPTMSFATPCADVSDWSDAQQALSDAFAKRGRSTRLEYLTPLEFLHAQGVRFGTAKSTHYK